VAEPLPVRDDLFSTAAAPADGGRGPDEHTAPVRPVERTRTR
jgi:hypothetical protein